MESNLSYVLTGSTRRTGIIQSFIQTALTTFFDLPEATQKNETQTGYGLSKKRICKFSTTTTTAMTSYPGERKYSKEQLEHIHKVHWRIEMNQVHVRASAHATRRRAVLRDTPVQIFQSIETAKVC
jgi:hypothetical protein